ncbi:alpha-galactosidase [Ruficoccus sp. ZRK36]|uniref:alpha-galactosidase n=1 Tax=Ruficoccus sp. ZRK36 TaxID=2866311 RepID=UPI001C731646|nr:alpha-galactosidase [Ruficoccus sp. ZRK36]QYY37283.1 alpha-galactosidase [Ruficoccus sp. ZRK36]
MMKQSVELEEQIQVSIAWENKFVRIGIELEPVFAITELVDKRSGKNVLYSTGGTLVADDVNLPDPVYQGYESVSQTEYRIRYQIGDITLMRHLFFYREAPALRWYDTLTTESPKAAMYYSDLAALAFADPARNAKIVNYFNCTDQSNRRLIESEATIGKHQGAFFVSDDIFVYKEGPMPDCQPIKGEYDFIVNEDTSAIRMVGLGFDNLRPDEVRRANGVVVGLSSDWGLKRYQRERYADFPASAYTEVLSNSWPDLTLGVDEAAIDRELTCAAESGVNVVFIDDGWFSLFMGEIDEVKFPNRFTVLAQKAKRLGIELGLWCNPLGLDIRHPKMVQWDGAECHDTMLENNPWNWLARTDDFKCTELNGEIGDGRGYSPIELMKPDCFAFMKDKLISFYTEFGIRHFKFDLYQLTAFNTMLGDANLHYEMYRQLMEELKAAIPGLVVSMDVTRRNRPNLDFALDYGRLFLENRGRDIPDHRYYHPHMALGNLWQALKYAPVRQCELEMMPQIDDYPLNYILGTTLFATPLYWGLIENTSHEKRSRMKAFFQKMAPIREKLADYLTNAVGDLPEEGSWSGIISIAPDESEGYLAVYRNGADDASYDFSLPFGTTVEPVYSPVETTFIDNKITVTLSEPYAFALVRFQ